MKVAKYLWRNYCGKPPLERSRNKEQDICHMYPKEVCK
jgi:hypothetical protein